MDAIVEYDLIDIRPDAVETPRRAGEMSVSSDNGCVMENHRDQLVRDIKLALEQSLEKFEERITNKITGDGFQQSQLTSAFPPSTQHTTCISVEQPVHENVFCDHCNSVIVGVRYKCGMCNDYDLCERCESQRPHQQRSHLFIKIYEPISASPNQLPLLSPELGATSPFFTFFNSLGTKATLEVQHTTPLEVRELGQANGSQFYLRDSGRQLCKDYQLVNRSGRNLQAGEYRLEHVYSTGLDPVDNTLPIPEIPEGHVRILCIAWQLPSQLFRFILSRNDDRQMQQASSVFRIKDRQGKQFGGLITASVGLLSPPSKLIRLQPMKSASMQTDDESTLGNGFDDSFELIGDDELPSCFVLPPISPPLIATTSGTVETAPECQLIPVEQARSTESTGLPPQPLRPPPPPPPRTSPEKIGSFINVANSSSSLACTEIPANTSAATATCITTSAPTAVVTATATAASATAIAGSVTASITVSPNQNSQSQRSSPSSDKLLIAFSQLAESQNTVHPSTVLAASYMPKASQWMPPKPKPMPETNVRFSSDNRGGGSASSATTSTTSGDIWGQRGEASERMKMQKLLEMGFYRRDVNARVMRECDWDFEAALNRLSEMYKDW